MGIKFWLCSWFPLVVYHSPYSVHCWQFLLAVSEKVELLRSPFSNRFRCYFAFSDCEAFHVGRFVQVGLAALSASASGALSMVRHWPRSIPLPIGSFSLLLAEKVYNFFFPR